MGLALVTGGSGFIGRNLVAALVAQGRPVRVLDLHAPPLDVDHVQGSVLDRDVVDAALREVDEVYHLAGLPGMWLPRKQDFHRVNCEGTQVVIAAARKRGVARFLHCSTESILFHTPGAQANGAGRDPGVDDMPGPYTRSKMLAERSAAEAAASGFPLVIASPTMPIGPHDHNLTPPTAMLRHFLDKRLQFYLDFIVNLVDVRDVASGLILAMDRGQVGQRYLLGGESMPLRQVLRLVAAIEGRRSLLVPIPGRLAEAATGALEFVADHLTHREPSGTAEGVRIAMRAVALPVDQAARDLGYAPRPVEPALRETVAYLRAANGGR